MCVSSPRRPRRGSSAGRRLARGGRDREGASPPRRRPRRRAAESRGRTVPPRRRRARDERSRTIGGPRGRGRGFGRGFGRRARRLGTSARGTGEGARRRQRRARPPFENGVGAPTTAMTSRAVRRRRGVRPESKYGGAWDIPLIVEEEERRLVRFLDPLPPRDLTSAGSRQRAATHYEREALRRALASRPPARSDRGSRNEDPPIVIVVHSPGDADVPPRRADARRRVPADDRGLGPDAVARVPRVRAPVRRGFSRAPRGF